MMRLRAAVVTLAVAALLGACEESTLVPAQCWALSSTVTIRNQAGAEAVAFGPGEPVTVQVVMENESSEPVTVALDDTCNPTYLEVRNGGGDSVWRGACPPGHCLCASDTKTFAPGERVTIADSWDQLANGDPAPVGPYAGHAVDASDCAPRLDDSHLFTLVN